MSSEGQEAFEALEDKIRTILPEEYQDSYEDVQPVSMGSAGLKFGSDGRVAWNQIWGSFCDLAMAGGPPHKGVLLEPGSRVAIEANPDRYGQAVDEICRGITMVTDLPAAQSPDPGWVRVDCLSEGMAAWLVRAIVMENVSVRCDGALLHIPAGPEYRLEKEIKNVITVMAKTCHYWLEHMWAAQQHRISNLLAKMTAESPLIQPALSGPEFGADCNQMLRGKMAETIQQMTGLSPSNHQYGGWLGFECREVHPAIWMMRALVASNVLSRREGTVLFVPVNPASDPDGETVIRSVIRIHAFATARAIV
jgi:sirohydrochlorin cobaltochelatase